MSEYQYYEFQALDRRLTETELAAIRKLSSRVKLTPTSASFVYNWSDFPGRAEAVLEQYFDAMLYIANWGSRRLLFRFPKSLLPVDIVKSYCVPFAIALRTTDKYALLDISIEKEGGEWIDTGEGLLTGLIGLREAILRGDYRALYLAWLRAASLAVDFDDEADEVDVLDDEEISIATLEPPVPSNLKQLDAGLEAFIDFFEIDPLWVDVGAANSPTLARPTDHLEEWIQALPEAECRKYLLRVAQGEANVTLLLVSDLRQRFGRSEPGQDRSMPRTVRDLYAMVKNERKRAVGEQRKAAEVARIKRLKSLAEHYEEMWAEVTKHILRRNSGGYSAAVSLMCELREVADFQGTQAAFVLRVEEIRQQFLTYHSLLSKMSAAGLIKK